MAKLGFLEGPPQHTQANSTAENPHASCQAMTWNKTATFDDQFDDQVMPKSGPDRLAWLRNSQIDQRAWVALIDNTDLFKVVYDQTRR